MSQKTGIEWTDATWNPLRGCSRVSEGCEHCYAEMMAARFSGPGQPFAGFAKRVHGKPHWTGKVELVESKLLEPLHWKKPQRVFVNSMSDLFHEAVPDETLDRIFAVMALCPQHTFQILTKRAERMREYLERVKNEKTMNGAMAVNFEDQNTYRKWPLPNVWLGVSAENQERANERIPHLLETPAAVRWVSFEPALGGIDFAAFLTQFCPKCMRHVAATRVNNGKDWGCPRCRTYTSTLWKTKGLDWIVAGGESGPGARPAHPDWFRSVRDQCAAAGVPFLFKQWGVWNHGAPRRRGTPGNFAIYRLPPLVAERPIKIESYPSQMDLSGANVLERIGKKAAGRLLDGRRHDEYPAAAGGQGGLT